MNKIKAREALSTLADSLEWGWTKPEEAAGHIRLIVNTYLTRSDKGKARGPQKKEDWGLDV